MKSLEVGVKVATLRELLLTVMTLERFLSRVRPHMRVQMTRLRKGL